MQPVPDIRKMAQPTCRTRVNCEEKGGGGGGEGGDNQTKL